MRDPLPWLVLAGVLSLLAVAAVIWALRLRRKGKGATAVLVGLAPLVIALGGWYVASLYVPPLKIDEYASQLNQSVVKFRDDRGKTPVLESKTWPKPLYGAVDEQGKRYAKVDPRLIASIGGDNGLVVTTKPQLQFSSMVVYDRLPNNRYVIYSVAYQATCVDKKSCERVRHTWRVCTMGDELDWWRPSECSDKIVRTTSADADAAEQKIRGLRADRR